MAGLTIADATHAHRRGWFAPASLAAAHFLFNAWFDPFRNPVHLWPFMFCAGVFYIQPVLFAAWAAIGPPLAIKRVLLSMAAYAAVLIGSASLHTYLHGSPDNFSMMVMMPVLFAVTFIALVIVGKFTRWRIDVASSVQVVDSTGGQFSLKFLMVFTAICAVLLATGRGLSWVEESGAFDFARFCTMIGVVLMLLFPAFILPLTALSPQLSKRTLIVVPILCVIFTGLAVVATLRFEPGADPEMIGYVLMVQLGALVGGLLSALFLRFNGYRLICRNAMSSASPAPSP